MTQLGQINTIVVLGKPGAGKGTQTERLQQKLGFSSVGYGDFFRSLGSQSNFVAHKVKATIDQGNLLPYWFPAYILLDKLFHNVEDGESIILDGAARSQKEAELLHEAMMWFERPYRAIYIDVPDEVVLERLDLRREQGNRVDDNQEYIKNRLEIYHKTVIPAISYFRDLGMLIEINGDQSVDGVFDEIMTKLQVNGLI